MPTGRGTFSGGNYTPRRTTKKNAFCSFLVAKRFFPKDAGTLVEGTCDVYICGEGNSSFARVIPIGTGHKRTRHEQAALSPRIRRLARTPDAAGPRKTFIFGGGRPKRVLFRGRHKPLQAASSLPRNDRTSKIDKSNILLGRPHGGSAKKRYCPHPWPAGLKTCSSPSAMRHVHRKPVRRRRTFEKLAAPKMLHAADFDIESAPRGILYIDEIDKPARRVRNVLIPRRSRGRRRAARALLKMPKARTANVPPQGWP